MLIFGGDFCIFVRMGFDCILYISVPISSVDVLTLKSFVYNQKKQSKKSMGFSD